VHGLQLGLLQSPVNVAMRGGELQIHWDGPGQPVMMTGPAVVVFEGELNI
jgi:diaminopimelate epimerase